MRSFNGHLLLAMGIGVSCVSIAQAKVVVRGCVGLKEDQSATFTWPMAKAEVPVFIDSAFTDDEKRSILAAAEIWNDEARAQGRAGFYFVTLGKPEEQGLGAPFDPFAGTYPPKVYVLKETSIAHWNSLGLTSATNGNTHSESVNEVMFRQTIRLFPALGDPSILTYVALHECGHAIGLGHSCGPQAGDGIADCAGLAESSPYRQAIMYPTMVLGDPATADFYVHPKLQENDRLRASCLYPRR